MAGVHDNRLHVPLDPPGPLADPVPRSPVGLFVRRAVDDADGITECGGTDAEIGVLRNIERVPATKLAQALGTEVVGRTAERYGQPELLEPGQHVVEPE